jgi:hypothetical protein
VSETTVSSTVRRRLTILKLSSFSRRVSFRPRSTEMMIGTTCRIDGNKSSSGG